MVFIRMNVCILFKNHVFELLIRNTKFYKKNEEIGIFRHNKLVSNGQDCLCLIVTGGVPLHLYL